MFAEGRFAELLLPTRNAAVQIKLFGVCFPDDQTWPLSLPEVMQAWIPPCAEPQWPLFFKKAPAASGRSFERYKHVNCCDQRLGHVLWHTWGPILNHISLTDIGIPKLGHVYILEGKKRWEMKLTKFPLVNIINAFFPGCCGHSCLEMKQQLHSRSFLFILLCLYMFERVHMNIL